MATRSGVAAVGTHVGWQNADSISILKEGNPWVLSIGLFESCGWAWAKHKDVQKKHQESWSECFSVTNIRWVTSRHTVSFGSQLWLVWLGVVRSKKKKELVCVFFLDSSDIIGDSDKTVPITGVLLGSQCSEDGSLYAHLFAQHQHVTWQLGKGRCGASGITYQWSRFDLLSL